jgi:hypothetical protein
LFEKGKGWTGFEKGRRAEKTEEGETDPVEGVDDLTACMHDADMPTRHALLLVLSFLLSSFPSYCLPFWHLASGISFPFCHDLTDGNGEAYKAGD